MARYTLKGYETPEGVDSREAVKEYQKKLGVKADGIWGPKTEAAYRESQKKESETVNLYKQYYDMIMSSVSVPSFSVYTPSRTEIEKDVSGYLRPSVDSAIKRRRETGEVNKAELDADAAARGMGRSTYVSSMKEREADDVEDDVDSLEAQYLSALSERVEDALRQYRQMQLDAEKAYASAHATASSAAMSMANGYYSNYLARAEKTAGTNGGGTRKPAAGTVADLTYEDCEQYLGMLTGDQVRSLYYSGDSYWADRRAEMEYALTYKQFEELKDKNVATGVGSIRYYSPGGGRR